MQTAVFTPASTRRAVSPWGAEVKKRLIDRQMQQDDLVSFLQGQGFQITKFTLSNLLYGIGTSNRQREIESISDYLGIPYRSGASDRAEAQ